MNGQSVLRFGGNDYYGMGNPRTTAGTYTYFGVTASTSSAARTGRGSCPHGTGSARWNGSTGATAMHQVLRQQWICQPYPPLGKLRLHDGCASGKKIMGLRLGNDTQNNSEWLTGDMSEVLIYTSNSIPPRTASPRTTDGEVLRDNAQTAQPPTHLLPLPSMTCTRRRRGKGTTFDVCGVGRVDASNQLLRTNDPSIISQRPTTTSMRPHPGGHGRPR